MASADGSVWFLGLSGGTVRTMKKEQTGWVCEDMALHDEDEGHITDITITLDHTFLVECGNDGNVFVFELVNASPPTLVAPLQVSTMCIYTNLSPSF